MVIYFSFIRISTANERETLISKATNIIENVPVSTLLTQGEASKIRAYLPDNTMIRVIDPESKIINQVTNETALEHLSHEFKSKLGSKLYTIDKQTVLMVNVPIKQQNTVVGTLEISEKLTSLNDSIHTLVSILFFSTIAAVILTVMSSFLLTKMMLRPLNNMIQTMKNIDQSFSFQNIPLKGNKKDEIYQLISTFNHMIERLELNFKKQQHFVSDASHELKTPLTIIESYANLLKRWGTKDKDIQLEAIESIHSEAIHMKKMVQQLLELSSSENEGNLNVEEINLKDLCTDVIDRIKFSYNREIIFHVMNRNTNITGNSVKIRQLLFILLENGLKYSVDTIYFTLKQLGDKVFIVIKDNGVGIPKEDLELIFERFYRVDKSRERKTGGTGIGLSIAKKIVDNHGGTITVKSKEKAGTEVTVILPISPIS